MRIRLITLTHKLPSWVKAGFEDYAKRMPAWYRLELVEIPLEKRGASSDLQRVLQREEEKMLAAIHPQHLVIALDVKGKLWDTETLATQLATWQQKSRTIDLLVGGPEGLSIACLARAQLKWSLSPLTFPHFLVRLIVAEQIFRAFAILNNHPYHRG